MRSLLVALACGPCCRWAWRRRLTGERARPLTEKEADAKARTAIKLQIEADKKARAERTALEKQIRDGGVVDVGTGRAAEVAKPAAASSGAAGKDYPETRLQVRTLTLNRPPADTLMTFRPLCAPQARLATGGPPLTKTLPSTATLTDVAEWLASESLAFTVDSVTISTRFPTKTFARAEFGASLRELGLTPSAVRPSLPPRAALPCSRTRTCELTKLMRARSPPCRSCSSRNAPLTGAQVYARASARAR